jgi:hypothetical protein
MVVETWRKKYSEHFFCPNSDHYFKWRSTQHIGKGIPRKPKKSNVKCICTNCGIEFEKPYSGVRYDNNFHSTKCRIEWKAKQAKLNAIEVKCCICGNSKFIKKSRFLKGKDKTCSKKCEAALKSQTRIGRNNPNYREDADRGDYCIKFNRPFREGVRIIWGYRCGLCEKPQSENIVNIKGEIVVRRLSIHHVHYKKSACCDNEPRKWHFMPLCAECHGKSNGDRKKFEEKCMDIINTKMNGNSYMPELEYKQHFKTHALNKTDPTAPYEYNIR